MTASTNSKNLRRDIIIILSIKVSIVLAAAIFVFGPDRRPRIDDTALDRHILDKVSGGNRKSLPMTSIDVVSLSRMQFGLTALYHFLFFPLTLERVAPG